MRRGRCRGRRHRGHCRLRRSCGCRWRKSRGRRRRERWRHGWRQCCRRRAGDHCPAHKGQDDVIAGSAHIANLELGTVRGEHCSLGKAGERSSDRIGTVIVDDDECVADGWCEAESDVQHAGERHCAGEIELIELRSCRETVQVDVQGTRRNLIVLAGDVDHPRRGSGIDLATVHDGPVPRDVAAAVEDSSLNVDGVEVADREISSGQVRGAGGLRERRC